MSVLKWRLIPPAFSPKFSMMEAYADNSGRNPRRSPAAVLIAGSATRDTILLGGEQMRKIGGVATYAGITFRKHGIATHVLTNLAPEDGSLFHAYLKYGIHLHVGRAGRTTCFVNRMDGDSRTQEVPGRALPIPWDACRGLLGEIRHVHLGPLHPEDLDEAWFQGLKEFAGLISLDVQGYMRNIRDGRVTASVSPLLEKALQACCVIKATEQEFGLILNAWKMDQAEFLRRFRLDEILVTCGRSGGYLLTGRHERTEYPAVPAGGSGDTTGAGDVLFAAYLAARHYHGLGRGHALLHAARIASLHVGGGYIPPEDLLIRPGQDRPEGKTD